MIINIQLKYKKNRREQLIRHVKKHLPQLVNTQNFQHLQTSSYKKKPSTRKKPERDKNA